MNDINKYRCIHLADYKDTDNLCSAIERIKELERQIKIKDAYCNMIYMLGVDYDGCNTVGSLKSLIDELVNCAERAYRSDDKYVVGESLSGKCYNILYEEVEKPENFESMFKE